MKSVSYSEPPGVEGTICWNGASADGAHSGEGRVSVCWWTTFLSSLSDKRSVTATHLVKVVHRGRPRSSGGTRHACTVATLPDEPRYETCPSALMRGTETLAVVGVEEL